MKNQKTMTICCVLFAALWLVLTAAAWFSPQKDVSESERRQLEKFPTVTVSGILDGSFMSKFEHFTQDQFPYRDGFRRIRAVFNRLVLGQKDNNGIYLADGYLAKLEYPLNQKSVDGAVKKFQTIYDTYLDDSNSNIVFCVVPDKGYYLAEPNGYPTMDYDALFAAFQNIKWAKYADLTKVLSIDDYYRTDTHWRQERLENAAGYLLNALGKENRAEFTPVSVLDDFHGVYYGQAALPVNGESLCLMQSDVLEGCTVTNHETGKQTGVYAMDRLSGRDPYEVYLSGSVSLLTISNPACNSGSRLIVFRDSFGSSMIPLLIPAYSEIVAIDTRYIPTAALGSQVDFSGSDVLFLYSTLVLNNSAMLK